MKIEHELVPKHIILTENEREQVIKRYGAQRAQFPKILLSDPVIKALGGKVGDVVKIIRKSPIIGEGVYYRVVVKG